MRRDDFLKRKIFSIAVIPFFLFPLIGNGEGDLLLESTLKRSELSTATYRIYHDLEKSSYEDLKVEKEKVNEFSKDLIGNRGTATKTQVNQLEYYAKNKEKAYYLPVQLDKDYKKGFAKREELVGDEND